MDSVKVFLMLSQTILVNSVQCPATSQWSLMTQAKCNKTHPEYYCLLDENIHQYVESCRKEAEFQRPGYKFVIHGWLDGKTCEADRYQPIKFWTNGSSDCIFLKSTCVEEGQIITFQGHSTSDRSCKCDYTRGYAFVAQPQNRCYCVPAEEDCTCYKKTCKLFESISPDYECLSEANWTGHYKCATIDKSSMSPVPPSTTVRFQDYKEILGVRRHQELIAGAGIVGVIFLGVVFVLWIQVKGFVDKVNHYIIESKQDKIKLRLKVHYTDIVKTIQHDDIVFRLIQSGIFDENDKAMIDNEPDELRKKHKLLQLIWNHGEAGYETFLSALREKEKYNDLSKQIAETDENIYHELDDKFKELEKELDAKKSKQDRFKLCLKVHYKDIVLTIQHDVIVVRLIRSGIFDEKDKAKIDKEPDEIRKNHKLLQLLWNRGEAGYDTFLRVLQEEKSYNDLSRQIAETDENISHELEEKLEVLEKELDAKNNANEIYKRRLKVNYKAIVTTIKHKKIVEHLIQKKIFKESYKDQIDTCLGRKKRNHKLLEFIWINGSRAYEEFISALKLDSSYAELARQIEQTNVTVIEELEAKMLELEEEHNEKIPKKTREMFDQRLEEWFKQDKKFIETEATRKVEEQLRRLNCAFLVGSSGVGKTSILRHIALHLWQEEGYDIIPIVISSSDILSYNNSLINQVFVVVNLCGQDAMNFQVLDIWKSQILEIMELIDKNQQLDGQKQPIRKGAIKLLISCDTKIYKDQSFEPLLKLFSEYKVDIIDYPLTEEERWKMIQGYASLEENTNIKDMKLDQVYFPWVCRLSQGKTTSELKALFGHPFDFIEKYFTKMQMEDHLQYCILTICTLLENEIRSVWFTDIASGKVNAIRSILSELDLDVTKDTMGRIQERLDTMDMTYLTKRGDAYHFINEEIYDIASVVCGTLSKQSFLNHSSVMFISERYQLETVTANDEAHKIKLNEADSEIYFNRLLNDLKAGNTYSTFHNSQLKDELYRVALCKFCRQNEAILIERLKQLKGSQNAESQCEKSENNKNYSQINVKKNDYDKLKMKDYFKFNNTKMPMIEAAWEGYADLVSLLIDMELEVNEIDAFGRTATFVACMMGKLDVVKVLVEKGGADFQLCDSDRRSPLYAACDEGYGDIVEYLISSKADLSVCDIEDRSPLFIASEGGHKYAVEILLRYSTNEINKTDIRGRTPFFAAITEGHRHLIDLLLNETVVDKCDNEGKSPLFIACERGRTDIVKILLEKNACVLKCDTHNQSPLFIACSKGYEQIATLLSKKSDINQCDKDEKTALYIACENGYANIVTILLKNHADVNKCDRYKRSPLYVACKRGHFEIVELLSKNKADLSLCNKWNSSPVFVASREGQLKIVEFLISCNANVSICNVTEGSPLHIACEEGRLEIVKLLLEERVTRFSNLVNLRKKDNRLPLHLAANRGHEDIVKLLLRNNASNSFDNNGQTPADLARSRGFDSIAQLIESN